MESANLVMHNLADSIASRIIYYIEKTVLIEVSNDNYYEKLQSEVFRLGAKGQNYLAAKIRKMRLFIPGNIMLPLQYAKSYAPFPILPEIGYLGGSRVLQELYHLESDTIPRLEAFLSEVEIPFSDEILQVSFDLFELSYNTGNPILSFLICMIAIEALLNPDRNEIRNRVSRNLCDTCREGRK